jgi:DNA-binding CsgD family transcriptional regulator
MIPHIQTQPEARSQLRQKPGVIVKPLTKQQIHLQRQGGYRPNKWGLSPREIGVLEAYADGLACKQIGERLNISSKTVSTYLRRARIRMEVSHLIAAIILWDRETYVRPEPITAEEVLFYTLGRQPNDTEREINFRNWYENPKVYMTLEANAREKREAARADNRTS